MSVRNQIAQLNNNTANLPDMTLNQLLECGIISKGSLVEKLMTTAKVLQQHKYKITEPKDSNGYWRTHYIDENGNRKDIKVKTKEELVKRLVAIYTGIDKAQKITFQKLFWEWLEYKRTITASPNTIQRHRQHYMKYFHDTEIDNKPIANITEIYLEKFLNNMVKSFNITHKEYGNVKGVVNGMFEYAVRMKYLQDNIVPKVKIGVKFKQIVHKKASTQVYNTDEKKELFEYLDKMYSETEDTVYIAVKINFYLGLRVAELVALKWSDMEEDSVHVVREEIRNQETNVVSVEEHTKTHTDRFVILTPTVKKLFEELRCEHKDTDYIFTRKGERITARQTAYVLEKYAERKGIPVKSTHKMRKTYASCLSAQGVPLDYIREELGHSSIQTTLSYIYNPLTEEETKEKIYKAFEGK